MASTQQTAAPETTERKLTLLVPFNADGRARIRISEARGRKIVTTDYNVVTFPSGIGGIAMSWENLRRGVTHDCRLDGKASTCDCEHGSYKPGAKFCRHIAAGLRLLALGLLVVPGVVEDMGF